MIAFDAPLRDQAVAIRADLMVGETIELAYPQAVSGAPHGLRDGSYVHFTVPRVWQHMIATAPAVDVGAAFVRFQNPSMIMSTQELQDENG